MSMLFRIVYAAHASGTHHKLALDGLAGLQLADAEGWRRLFLLHAERFMDGAKAPDTTFKDFKNHVLHVRDAYWGGAPELTRVWYDRTVSALREARWEDAVYAAGVTSHYYTDPIMPFHTGQTEAENAIHAACEWSINRSYDSLRRAGLAMHPALAVAAADGETWLEAMVVAGAERANRHYEKLIAHYDIHTGVVDPPSGLDAIARAIVADLLVYAAAGYACILEQAISEAAVAPPDVTLTLPTILAAVRIPAKSLAKRLANAEDRAAVLAMYDELKATGRVESTLREDDRTVRDLHAREVLAPREAGQVRTRAARLAAAGMAASGRFAAATSTLRVPTADNATAPIEGTAEMEPLSRLAIKKSAAVLVHDSRSADTEPRRASSPDLGRRAPQTHLREADEIEAAPSIGPRMAERLGTLGLKSVRDLLSAEPSDVAERLGDRRIDDGVVAQWQQQARLVMAIVGLRGGHAQLLTGAGYTDAAAIAAADPVKLSADVLAFAATAEGARILRDGSAPDLERIKSWIEAARNAEAA